MICVRVRNLIKPAPVITFALLLAGCAINYDHDIDHDPRAYIKIEPATVPPARTLEANKSILKQDDDVLAYSPTSSGN
jgi:hypothetical protein